MLLFKIRNKKIDLAVYIINIMLIILFYYMLEEKKYVETGKDYTFYKNFWFNWKYFLLPFPLYYIDFNICVMYFLFHKFDYLY